MLLKKAENETAYLSASIYGFPGSGKSFTAACMAIGLQGYLKSKRPVAYIDTEAGTDFLLPHYRHNGIEVIRSKSRAFADVLPTMKEAQNEGAEILIVDSCTHLWAELIAAYEEKYRRTSGLQFQDWKNVKGEWANFMTAVLNEPMHMLLLGRAGYEYDYVDIDGKKTLVKTKTKMRAEGQTEHEPSITLEMAQMTLTDDEIRQLALKQKAGISTVIAGQFSKYIMFILKDRANFLTGSVFKYDPMPGKMIEPDNQPFKDITPFVEAINIGGAHAGVDTSRNSGEMFAGPDDSYTENKKRKEIVLEKIIMEMKSHFGTSKEDNAKKKALLEKAFHSTSWKEIEGMSLNRLDTGYGTILLEFQEATEEAAPDNLPQSHAKPSPSDAAAGADFLKDLNAFMTEGNWGLGKLRGFISRAQYPLEGKDPRNIRPLVEQIDGRKPREFNDQFKAACVDLLGWYMDGRPEE